MLAGILLCRFFSITFTSWIYYLFLKRFYYIQRGWDSVLGCCLPINIRKLLSSSSSLSFLSQLCVPTQLQGLFVLRELEQLPGGLLEGKATHTSDYGPHELGVLGKVLLAADVPRLVHVLGYRVAFLRLMNIGWCRAMATALHWLSPPKCPHCIEPLMDF